MHIVVKVNRFECCVLYAVVVNAFVVVVSEVTKTMHKVAQRQIVVVVAVTVVSFR